MMYLNAFNAMVASVEEVDEAIATIKDQYTYHAPSEDQIKRMESVREALIGAANSVLANVPPSADRSTALRKLREARMDANAAIVHNGKY